MIKDFTKNYIYNVIFAFILLSTISLFWQTGLNAYYKYAPIETFYQAGLLLAEDVTTCSETQTLISERVVKNTDTGYPAEVIRELSLVTKNGTAEYFKESKNVFVQVDGNGGNTRVQQLPDFLVEGEYFWVIYITLYVNGVERNDVPPLISNIFNVTACI